MIRFWVITLGVLGGMMLATNDAYAGVKGQVFKELSEFVARKFGKKLMQEGTEAFSKRLASASVKGGKHVVPAVRNCGPKGLALIEGAGELAPHAARAMSMHGSRGMLAVASRPTTLKLVGQHGDDVIEACVKHLSTATPVITGFGKPAAAALAKIGTTEGRHLAMLNASGELKRIGRSKELLAVIAKYGDSAMAFIWKNKVQLVGTTAVTAATAAFLKDPEPFITGAKDLTQVVADSTIRPVAESAGKAIEESAAKVIPSMGEQTNGSVVIITFAIVAVLFVGAVFVRFGRRLMGSTS